MKPTEQKETVLSRRSMIFAAAATLPFAVLMGRVYALQVIGGQKYRRLSEQNRISLRVRLPQRGLIYDQEGRILAENFKAFRLSLIRERMEDPKKTLGHVASLIELPPHLIKDAQKRMARSPKFLATPIKDFLNFSEVARLQVNLPDLPGVVVEEIQARTYPSNTLAAHVLGFMGPVTPADLRKSKARLLRQPDFRIGKQGAEAYFDESLRGKAGTDHVEVNARGREVRVLSQVAPQKGADASLTLVHSIQEATEKALEGYKGAAVLLDVHNGHVLALASSPTFNPNDFVYGLNNKKWQGLQRDATKPLLNRCCRGHYPPGSTFKMIVALAALEEGIIEADKKIECTGKIYFGNRFFHCWDEDGHGKLDLHHALAQSCDIYFYELGRILGIEKIKAYAQKFGLGEKTGLFLPESAGLIPSKEWKKARTGKRWNRGEDLIAAIGQGYLLTTPMQLAVMTARLATGTEVTPTLVPRTNIGPLFNQMIILVWDNTPLL